MLHTGRMLINLKPRHGDAGRGDGRGCASACAQVRRRDALPAADAGPDHRRRDRADPVPRVARRRRHRDRRRVGEQAGRSELRNAQRAAQRHHRRRRAGRWRPSSTSTATRAARLAITASAVDDALYSAFGQRIVSTIFTETNQYRVILEAQPGLLGTAEALGKLQLRTGSGEPTPLSAIATHHASGPRRCRSRTSRSTRPPTDRLRHRARRVARHGGRRDPRGGQGRSTLPPAVHADLPRRRRAPTRRRCRTSSG